ncbi:MAG TPA: DUF4349 domain-containing protein [Solirubrobacteraceae bacterium]|nr:DUF4349 domain-containing protein [Solirubrobacteraceae bacterium]
MSRDELSAQQLAELAALDRILAREPVGEEHLELAALVDSVRAGAPRMDGGFAARLDATIAQRVAGSGARRARLPRLSPRRFAFAGGGLVAAAVALTIVISGGLLNSREPNFSPPATSGPRLASPSAAGHARVVAPTATFGATASPAPLGASGASNSATSVTPSAHGRLVQRGSTLTLATTPATMQAVANRVVAATERQGGVVESSNVEIQGSASYASFSLAVPSGRLGSLIATLSGLASVRALTQSTNDITDGYNQETARLADSVAERAALLKQLAVAATAADATSIQNQIDALARRIAAEHRAIDRLLNEGHTATVQVNVVPGASTRHSSAGGPLSRAFHDALHALEEILAIALIALAIVLPFALCALALWWAATSLRQRARERAMRTA